MFVCRVETTVPLVLLLIPLSAMPAVSPHSVRLENFPKARVTWKSTPPEPAVSFIAEPPLLVAR